MTDSHLDALRSSVTRLHDLAAGLPDDGLTAHAYPSEWSVADVLSHLGSGAVITRRRLQDALADRETPADFAPGVWDQWNAKPPVAQRDDALAEDAALLADLEAVSSEQRAAFSTTMGPLTLEFEQFVAMRLNEHAFHTWDIEVVEDPHATIPSPAAELVVDNLELIARFTGKPTGESLRVVVTTTEPVRRFIVELAPESVTFAPSPESSHTDLQLPAEAFARLVYGRLDPAHTPAGANDAALDTLRRVFPGP